MTALRTFVHEADRRLAVAASAARSPAGSSEYRELATWGAEAIDAAEGATVLELAEAHLLAAACLVSASETAGQGTEEQDAEQALDHLVAAERLVEGTPAAIRAHVLPRVAALTSPWERLAGVRVADRLTRLARALDTTLTEQHSLREDGIRDLTVARHLLAIAAEHPMADVARLRSAAAHEARAAARAFAGAGELHLAAEARQTIDVAVNGPTP